MSVFRVIQGIVGLMICPMLALGFMSSLSGGGNIPAFQIIGQRLVLLSVTLAPVCLIIAEVVHRRFKLTPVAIVVCLVPVAAWAWLSYTLQRETGFFG
ncbi:MAG: hypothetical protein AAF125_16695 [Chloroflexota bacterium]